jgi:hypothetical protein
LSFAFAAPDPWLALTNTERETRGAINSDLCTLDDHYFVRGCLDIPISGHKDMFSWSVWVSISKQSFDLIVDLWDEDVRSNRDPLFGTLCNSIPVYPQTYSLKTHLHLRDSGIRPFIELEPTDHPLAIEQREGITLQRVEQIAASVHLQ